MALRLLQNSIVANYDVSPNAKFYQGDALTFDISSPAGATGLQPVQQIGGPDTAPALSLGTLAGFSTSDHNITGNTLIQNDPVGSTIVSANGSLFTSYANGFYVGATRRIGDFQDESVAVVTNLTDVSATGNASPVRGVGVVRAHGSQIVTDRYDLTVAASSYTNGAPLYLLAGSPLLTTNTASSLIPARVDYFDATAGLLYYTIIA